jgi:pimeloyl-ACP methyl ester carboxylesterase
MKTSAPLAIDKTVTLDVDGSRQAVRLCGVRAGLPPLLVVQGGPALPLLHEVPKFQRRLHLEQDFLVAYWDQRGCGDVPAADAQGASMARQVQDLRYVLQWLSAETRQRVVLLGISIGGTIALQAAALEPDRTKAVVAISPDARTAVSDAAAGAFLEQHALAGSERFRKRVEALGAPPYVDPNSFQRRARLLADLGTIEYGRTFTALVREFLVALVRTYGLRGGVRALGNMNVALRRLLPEIAELDLLTHPPRVTVPVHYVFGEQDALTPASVVTDLPAAIAAPSSTVARLAEAGHMLHFDQPDLVRSIVVRA